MGNSQPKNGTGRKATAQKLENATKLGILSLSEHSLEEIPNQVFAATIAGKLRTLDLSKNSLSKLGSLGTLSELKILNVDHNKLPAGSLDAVSKLSKLQNLSASGNRLGKPLAQSAAQPEAVPKLPATLKQLDLSQNFFANVPRHIFSSNLIKLEKLDLSSNQLATVPEEIVSLKKLEELRLDSNMIVSLPSTVGNLSKLKVLSLRNNRLILTSTNFNDSTNPQPLPKSLFSDTLLIDLNLHGNKMTNTQLNTFDGFQDFLDRRQKVKSKTMSNFDVCGLE